ncbi:MAG: type II toxin-antitoxin system VapC family toxin [Deltaproteobacteria bacterium]|nr:type II toxin-antitoxin system VapC family toxin [Deltaproteobacteria bacterium]
MILMPDTNVWIKLLNPGNTAIKDRFVLTDPGDIRLCSVVKAELYFGAYKSARKEENIAILENLFKGFSSFSFADRAARIYGDLRARLAAQCSPIGPNDLMIAAIAIANKSILVTHNTTEFQRVSGLEIVDWEAC